MIDINLLRAEKGGDPNLVRQSQRSRGGEVAEAIVDKVLALDQEWIKAQFAVNQKSKEINAISKQFGALAKQKLTNSPEAEDLKKRKAVLEQEKQVLAAASDEKEKELFSTLKTIGNIVHSSVPVSSTEDDNAILETWWPEGRKEEEERAKREKLIKDGKGVPGLFSHHHILEQIAGYDPNRGAKVVGHRGYFLTGPGVDLNMALMQYGLNFLEQRGYTKIWTPFFMNQSMMAKTAQLEEFDEALYRVPDASGEDKYLIATSEQPLSAFHANEWFNPKELPKKYAGTSTCFRKEAGAHGRDAWGTYRVHQFEKIEQFVLTEPEKSWEMHIEMLNAAKEFYQSVICCNFSLNFHIELYQLFLAH
jgi:seryl-tRNA synthetase